MGSQRTKRKLTYEELQEEHYRFGVALTQISIGCDEPANVAYKALFPNTARPDVSMDQWEPQDEGC